MAGSTAIRKTATGWGPDHGAIGGPHHRHLTRLPRFASGAAIYEHGVVSWIAPDVARVDEADLLRQRIDGATGS